MHFALLFVYLACVSSANFVDTALGFGARLLKSVFESLKFDS